MSTPPAVMPATLGTSADGRAMQKTARCRSAIVLLDSPVNGEFLGLQFIFVLFPLTRVYAAEDSTSFALRELLFLLEERGYCVRFASSEHTPMRVAEHDDSLVLAVHAEASASTYDLLVVRRVHVSGSIRLVVARATEPVASTVPFSAGVFSRTGYTQQLSKLLKETMRTSLAEQLDAMLGPRFVNRARRKNPPMDAELFLMPPELPRIASATYRALAGEFSISDVPSVWTTELQFRLAQGMAEALKGETTSLVTWSIQSCRAGSACQHTPSWRIRTRVQNIAVQVEPEMLHLSLHFVLYDHVKAVMRAQCALQMPLTAAGKRLPLLSIAPAAKLLLQRFYLDGADCDSNCSDARETTTAVQCRFASPSVRDRSIVR